MAWQQAKCLKLEDQVRTINNVSLECVGSLKE